MVMSVTGMTGNWSKERNILCAMEIPKRQMLCSRTIREGVREELGLDLSHNVLSWGPKGIHGSHVGEVGFWALFL